MKLTKYEHACITVEKDGQLLVIDPGGWTTDLGVPGNVCAVVVTHEHGDHFDTTALGAIAAHNPDAVVIAHQAITRQLDAALPSRTVAAGDAITAGPFNLQFVGGRHAVIHPNIPGVANLGVIVDGKLYYPGDSFTVLDHRTIDTLALPASAPWLKISETMDFLAAIRPRLAFPTHDAILSPTGKALVDRLLQASADSSGTRYQRIDGQELDI